MKSVLKIILFLFMNCSTVISELEICDYGIPQITDAELLKKYI